MFWTNVFDWVGGSGGAVYHAEPVSALGSGWRAVDGEEVGGEPGLWPGLYERAEDGARRAVNALDVRFPPGSRKTDWRRRLADALGSSSRRREMTPALLVGSVACLALAMPFWSGRRRRRASSTNLQPDRSEARPPAPPAPTLQEAGMS